jgi:hypothetical protein
MVERLCTFTSSGEGGGDKFVGSRCDIVVRERGRRNRELVNVRRKPINDGDLDAKGGGPSVDDRFLNLLERGMRHAHFGEVVVRSYLLGGVVTTVGIEEGLEGLAAKGSRSSSSGKGSDPSKITSRERMPPSLLFTANGVISARP